MTENEKAIIMEQKAAIRQAMNVLLHLASGTDDDKIWEIANDVESLYYRLEIQHGI